jgi:hypothetical protein
MFHCGVEVFGFEWGFRGDPDPDTGTGVFCCEPRRCEGVYYRESTLLGETRASEAEVRKVIHKLEMLWPGETFDMLTHNSCHFCDELSRLLAVGPVPGWVLNCAESEELLDSPRKNGFGGALAGRLCTPRQDGCCCTTCCGKNPSKVEVVDIVHPLQLFDGPAPTRFHNHAPKQGSIHNFGPRISGSSGMSQYASAHVDSAERGFAEGGPVTVVGVDGHMGHAGGPGGRDRRHMASPAAWPDERQEREAASHRSRFPVGVGMGALPESPDHKGVGVGT